MGWECWDKNKLSFFFSLSSNETVSNAKENGNKPSKRDVFTVIIGFLFYNRSSHFQKYDLCILLTFHTLLSRYKVHLSTVYCNCTYFMNLFHLKQFNYITRMEVCN